MAQHSSHISFSAAVGIAYATGGWYVLHALPEHAILALAIILITGMLPDIDGGEGAPAKEVAALLAAIVPVVLVQSLPFVQAGGVARIALVVIVSYVVTRIFVVRGLQKLTTHRGMLHSIPASIIIFELAYLLFHDLYWRDRLYLASAAFIGFLSHLLLDASSNIDLVGKALGSGDRKAPALKIAGGSWGMTIAAYICLLSLGWYIAQDFYPRLRFYAGVNY